MKNESSQEYYTKNQWIQYSVREILGPKKTNLTESSYQTESGIPELEPMKFTPLSISVEALKKDAGPGILIGRRRRAEDDARSLWGRPSESGDMFGVNGEDGGGESEGEPMGSAGGTEARGIGMGARDDADWLPK